MPAAGTGLQMESGKHLYGSGFHSDRDARTRAAARATLEHVFAWCRIASVCDVGCGVGTWLAVAGDLGATELAGYEGPWG